LFRAVRDFHRRLPRGNCLSGKAAAEKAPRSAGVSDDVSGLIAACLGEDANSLQGANTAKQPTKKNGHHFFPPHLATCPKPHGKPAKLPEFGTKEGEQIEQSS